MNAKIKILSAPYYSDLEDEINSFLATIDVRQIIKTEFSSAGNSSAFRYTAIIYYIGIDDIRDIKIDNILKNPL